MILVFDQVHCDYIDVTIVIILVRCYTRRLARSECNKLETDVGFWVYLYNNLNQISSSS